MSGVPMRFLAIGSRLLRLGLSVGMASFFVLLVRMGSAQAAELVEIVERGYLVVGVKDNVRPLGFRGEAGQLQGLEIDLARRLGEQLLGDPDAVVLQPLSNRDRLLAVVEDRVDLTIARVTATRPRSHQVRFSDAYYLDGTALITLDPFIERLADIRQQTIAVLTGSSTIAVVRHRLPEARLIGVASYQDARSRLESGDAIAFAADVSVLSGWVQEYPQYHLIPALLSTEPLCVVMPRGLQYDDLHRQVSGTIRRWKSEGWLEERALHWGLPWANRGWNANIKN